MRPTWNELVKLLGCRVGDPRVIAVLARAGNAVDIEPSSIELRPHGVWLATFRDTVRSFSLLFEKGTSFGAWSGPLPGGITRSSSDDQIELPRRGKVIITAGYARGKLARVDVVARAAASSVKSAPRVEPTWQQIAATVGLSRSDPRVVALMLRSRRELGLKRNEVHLRQGPVLVMKNNRVAEARLHLEPSGYSGTWRGGVPPNVALVRPPGGEATVKRDGMVLTYGRRKLSTIVFRSR